MLSVLIWACVNIVDKNFVSRNIGGAGVATLLSAAASLAVLVAVPFFEKISFPSFFAVGVPVLGGVFWAGCVWFYYKALKVDEVSRVIPIFQLDPIFTAVLAAFFLGEVFSPGIYFGIVLLVAGAVLISLKKTGVQNGWKDILSSLRFGPGFRFILASTLLVSANGLAVKLALREMGFLSVFFWMRFGVVAASAPFVFIRGGKFVEALRRHPRSFALVFVSNLAGAGASLAFTLATALTYLTLVSAIAAVQPLFTLLLAAGLSFLLPSVIKENIGKKTLALKLFAILLIILGSWIVAR